MCMYMYMYTCTCMYRYTLPQQSIYIYIYRFKICITLNCVHTLNFCDCQCTNFHMQLVYIGMHHFSYEKLIYILSVLTTAIRKTIFTVHIYTPLLCICIDTYTLMHYTNRHTQVHMMYTTPTSVNSESTLNLFDVGVVPWS